MTGAKVVMTQVSQSSSVGLVVLIFGIGMAASILPMPSLAVAALLCSVVGLWAIPDRVAVGLPLFLILVIPADHINGLNGAVAGLFALGLSLSMAIASVTRYRLAGVRRMDWDLMALAGVLLVAGLIHAGSGELRNVVYWVAACLALTWLRGAEHAIAGTSRQVVVAMIGGSVIGSLFACIETLGGVRLESLIPGYEPHQLSFSGVLGQRGAGLSGHPLRLGTLTMLGTILSAAWMMGDGVSRQARLVLGAALLISIAGLVLSGARGAWLGLVAGAALAAIVKGHVRGFSRLAPLIFGAAALALVVWGTGLWGIVYERMFGIASNPGSFGQRFQALLAVADASRRVPLLGVGFGGADEITQDVGLRIPNLENEYLRFFLAAGWVGPMALLCVFIRRNASARLRAL